MQRSVNKSRVQNPNELLAKVKCSVIINIDTPAIIIQQSWGDQLRPPEPGLYLRGAHSPAVRMDRQYTNRHGLLRYALTQLDMFEQLYDTLYGLDGKTVLSAGVMREKSKFLSTAPDIPATALQLIGALVEQHIASRNPWGNPLARGSRLGMYFKPGSEELLEAQFIPSILSQLFEEVDVFIGEDEWCYYGVKVQGTGLIIEKLVDYRIYEWTRAQYDEQNAESGDTPWAT